MYAGGYAPAGGVEGGKPDLRKTGARSVSYREGNSEEQEESVKKQDRTEYKPRETCS